MLSHPICSYELTPIWKDHGWNFWTGNFSPHPPFGTIVFNGGILSMGLSRIPTWWSYVRSDRPWLAMFREEIPWNESAWNIGPYGRYLPWIGSWNGHGICCNPIPETPADGDWMKLRPLCRWFSWNAGCQSSENMWEYSIKLSTNSLYKQNDRVRMNSATLAFRSQDLL